MKKCVLEDKTCIECGKCNICDLDKNKICDNCSKCIIDNEKEYSTILIDEIILDNEDKK